MRSCNSAESDTPCRCYLHRLNTLGPPVSTMEGLKIHVSFEISHAPPAWTYDTSAIAVPLMLHTLLLYPLRPIVELAKALFPVTCTVKVAMVKAREVAFDRSDL